MEDLLRQAFARLSSLSDAVKRFASVGGVYLDEYREVLDHLEDAGIDVAGFEIPLSAVSFKVEDEPLVSGPVFRMKLNAILTYFTLEGPRGTVSQEEVQERIRIGFSQPARSQNSTGESSATERNDLL